MDIWVYSTKALHCEASNENLDLFLTQLQTYRFFKNDNIQFSLLRIINSKIKVLSSNKKKKMASKIMSNGY